MNSETTATDKLPWVKFSFDDYVNDLALSRCSLQAQAIWMRMLGIMHHGEPYGHLSTNGIPIEMKELAQRIPKMSGKRGADRVTKWVLELLKYGVVSQTKSGVFYCRRMVRDESIRLINRQNGTKGGNPNIKKSVNPPVNPAVNPAVNPDVDVEKGLQPKPYSSKSGVKHLTRTRDMEDTATALLARESPQQETAPPGTPPQDVDEFRKWVAIHVPAWVQKKAKREWADPSDKDALSAFFKQKTLFEAQALWQLFIRPGSKSYEHAMGHRFSMREFVRQAEVLIFHEDYHAMKRRYLEACAPGIQR